MAKVTLYTGGKRQRWDSNPGSQLLDSSLLIDSVTSVLSSPFRDFRKLLTKVDNMKRMYSMILFGFKDVYMTRKQINM